MNYKIAKLIVEKHTGKGFCGICRGEAQRRIDLPEGAAWFCFKCNAKLDQNFEPFIERIQEEVEEKETQMSEAATIGEIKNVSLSYSEEKPEENLIEEKEEKETVMTKEEEKKPQVAAKKRGRPKGSKNKKNKKEDLNNSQNDSPAELPKEEEEEAISEW